MRAWIALAGCGLMAMPSRAQWTLQTSGVSADLRGIDKVGDGVAWASGSHGTVLRTLDNGAHWQLCATPPEAETLDFRGIQAFDKDTAVVMSSGKGNLSRLYKTTDGCQTWKMIFPDPYGPDGFFDTMLFLNARSGLLFGDPTAQSTTVESPGDFRLRQTTDSGSTWVPITEADGRSKGHGIHAEADESAFAASNSAVAVSGTMLWFATSKARVVSRRLWTGHATGALPQAAGCAGATDALSMSCGLPWLDLHDAFAPVRHDSRSSGIFSLGFRNEQVGVATGGDYLLPTAAQQIAAFSRDGGLNWTSSVTQPHGYRSAVAYDQPTRTWVTVGPNGTDISSDDGRNWRALKPGGGDDPEADQHWNALSLPFAVGPHGRIGVLKAGALGPLAK